MKPKEVSITLLNGGSFFQGKFLANVYFSCPDCGKNICKIEDYNFCSKCGCRLKKYTGKRFYVINRPLQTHITTVESKLKETLIARGLWE